MRFLGIIAFSMLVLSCSKNNSPKPYRVFAPELKDRKAVSNTGAAIEGVNYPFIYILANTDEANSLKAFTTLYPLKETPTKSLKESKYHNYDELLDTLENYQLSYPEYVTLSSIGSTLENRDIPLIQISSPTKVIQKNLKRAVLIMGGHHAREHLSVDTTLRMIQKVLFDINIDGILDHFDFYFIPLVNPDGHVHDTQGSQGRFKYWRKNRRLNLDNSYGVDLNRNYSTGWATTGSSSIPSSSTYHGESSFSEPETLAIKSFVESIQDQLFLAFSFHSFGQLILYPWGYTHDEIKDKKNLENHVILGNLYAEDTAYSVEQSSDLYPAGGDTMDWIYELYGAYSYTIELDPGSRGEGGFYPEDEIISPVVDKNYAGLLKMLTYIVETNLSKKP